MRRRLWKLWRVLFALFVLLMVIFYFSIQEKRVGLIVSNDETRSFSVFRPLSGAGVRLSMLTTGSPELLAWLAEHQPLAHTQSCTIRFTRDCVTAVTGYPFYLELRFNQGEQQRMYPLAAGGRDERQVRFMLVAPEDAAPMTFWPGWSKFEVVVHDAAGVVPQDKSVLLVHPPLALFDAPSQGYGWLMWMFFWPIWLLAFVLWAGVMELVFWLQRRQAAQQGDV